MTTTRNRPHSAVIPVQPLLPHPTPTVRYTPVTTARTLQDRLKHHGLPTVYSFAYHDIAVVSIPQVSIWIRPTTITWTRHGESTTWPVHDPNGAADYIVTLLNDSSTPPPPPGP